MKIFIAISGTMLMCMALSSSCGKENMPSEDGGKIDNPAAPIVLTKAEREVADSANAFAFDVYRALYEGDQMLISPFSLSLALSMTACGADGNTAVEMSRTLGFDGYSPDDVAGYYNKMVTALTAIDEKTTFESANSVWIDKCFEVKQDFLATVKNHYSAEEKMVSFKDKSTVDQINKWCSDKTHEKIRNMVERLDPDAVMALVNAIYFNGEWGIDFDEKTRKENFTTIDGGKTKVDMMSVSHPLYYSAYAGWTMVELPYGNGAFKMDVILPPDGMPFMDAVKSFDLGIWNMLSSRASTASVNLKMPEFKFEYEAKGLPVVLSKLGMVDAFTDRADFSKIAAVPMGDAFYISDVKHKAFIDVNTKGTEAAAVTVVEMGFTTALRPSQPAVVDFTADRPFLFLIREQSTGSILFIGQKVK